MVILTQTANKLIIGTQGELSVFTKADYSQQNIKIPEPNLPPNLTKGQIETIKHGNKTVTCISSAPNGNFTAIATENKQVVLFDANFKVVRNFVTNRAVSKIVFTGGDDLLLADKTGDVTLYKVQNEASCVILGHLSMLLDVKLSDCGKFVVTCDRDEKIRISRFPNAFNIESYCLGHREFVTNVEVFGGLLVSASGDGTVRFWDFLKGAQLGVIDTNEQVDDKNLVGKFCSEMDEDRVDVAALPIRDMQVCKKGEHLIIGVVLMCLKSLLLYQTENNFPAIKTKFLHRIKCEDEILAFSLSSDYLYILSVNQLRCLKLINNDFVECGSLKTVDKLNLNCLKTNDVSVLYKRKFDNVQEYLERKKLRLEGKQ